MENRQSDHIFAFGDSAARFVRRVPTDVAVVACDGTQPAEAVAAALALRAAGTPTAVALVLEPDAAVIARAAAADICAQTSDIRNRQRFFDDLETRRFAPHGHPLHTLFAHSSVTQRVLRELLQMADVTIFRSTSERNRIEGMLEIYRPYVALMPDAPPPVHAMTHDPAGAIVVWAPHTSADALRLYAHALESIAKPGIFVCKGALHASVHTFVDPTTFASLRTSVAVVIDADLADPAAALAFAARGLATIAAQTSGAHEWAPQLQVYDPLGVRSVAAEVLSALAGRKAICPPREGKRQETALRTAFHRAVPPPVKQQPLVSVIMPTFNRPAYVHESLRSLAEQAHTNLEVIVVNDGGVPLEDVTADFPFVRLLNLPKNAGPLVAQNFGYAASQGTHIAFIPDDDRIFPHHIAALLRAMEYSGLPMAHANTAQTCFISAANQLVVYGHALHHDLSFDLAEILTNGMRIAMLGVLCTREFYERVGLWNTETHINSDFELLLRMAEVSDFAHCGSVGGTATIRADTSTRSGLHAAAAIDESEELMRRFTPPDRKSILARQERARETLRSALAVREEKPFPNVRIPLESFARTLETTGATHARIA